MRAGEYRTRLEWLQRTPGTPDGFGQRADTYPSQGYLWGAVEDLVGGRETAKESERQVTTATVRLRNYPAVVAGDRLLDVGLDTTWTVEHAVRGDNELVCEVSRPRWTAGGGEA
jgi:head-tail adaptor